MPTEAMNGKMWSITAILATNALIYQLMSSVLRSMETVIDLSQIKGWLIFCFADFDDKYKWLEITDCMSCDTNNAFFTIFRFHWHLDKLWRIAFFYSDFNEFPLFCGFTRSLHWLSSLNVKTSSRILSILVTNNIWRIIHSFSVGFVHWFRALLPTTLRIPLSDSSTH